MPHLKRYAKLQSISTLSESGHWLPAATVTATEVWEKLRQWYIANSTWKSKSWGWQDQGDLEYSNLGRPHRQGLEPNPSPVAQDISQSHPHP